MATGNGLAVQRQGAEKAQPLGRDDSQMDSQMNEEEIRELEAPENWDFEGAEKHEGTKAARAVVSVAFRSEDFKHVVQAAERAGMKTSEYIREAALQRVEHEEDMARVASFSGSLGASVYTREPIAVTRVSGSQVETNVPEPLTA